MSRYGNFVIYLIVLIRFSSHVYANISSCNDAKSSGVYTITPPGASYTVYCDVDTPNGPWMLLLSVAHAANTNDPVAQNKIPISPNTGNSQVRLDFFQSNGKTHYRADKIRFYCETSAHNRRIHFMTTNIVIEKLVTTGNQIDNSLQHWKTGWTSLSGHTGSLPGSVSSVSSAATTMPFLEKPFFSSNSYWNVGANGDFNCDDVETGGRSTTLHQVWVHVIPMYVDGAMPMPHHCGEVTSSGLHVIQPEAGGPTYAVHCDVSTPGGPWMLILSYRHLAHHTAPLYSGSSPLSTNYGGYSHKLLNEFLDASHTPAYRAIKARFYCTSSSHTRTIHFYSGDSTVTQIATDGLHTYNNPAHWNSQYTQLSDHSANLPGASYFTQTSFSSSTDALTNIPFRKNADNLWAINVEDKDAAGDTQHLFLCDDPTSATSGSTTLHQVWVNVISLVPDPKTIESCATASQSGVYVIRPVDKGPTYAVNCDIDTAGGPWMLLWTYRRAQGFNPPLMQGYSPLYSFHSYSHVLLDSFQDSDGNSALQADRVRFYCSSSGHNRVIHFYTDHPDVIYIAQTGSLINNAVSLWASGFTALSNHEANLPASTTRVTIDSVSTVTTGTTTSLDGQFWNNPFYTDDSNGRAYWSITPSTGAFLCDDYGSDATTLHQVWVRAHSTPSPSLSPTKPSRMPHVYIGRISRPPNGPPHRKTRAKKYRMKPPTESSVSQATQPK